MNHKYTRTQRGNDLLTALRSGDLEQPTLIEMYAEHVASGVQPILTKSEFAEMLANVLERTCGKCAS